MTDRLRSAILNGQLPPGATLTQRDIAGQLSVSRMPVREAFRALELEGLIRGLPRRKAVVVTLQPGEVADIYDILATLEARATEKAVPHHDATTTELLRQRLHELRNCPDDTPARLLDLDMAFHLGIYQPPSSRMRLAIQAHRNALRPHAISMGVAIERRQQAHVEHERIVAAIEARDPAAAARETAAHLRAEGRFLVERLLALRTTA